MNLYALGAIGASVISAGTSLGVGIWKQKRLEDSIDKLSKTITIDVEDEYIHKIVKASVDRVSKKKIEEATAIAVNEIRSDMSAQIRKEINANYKDLKASVKAEMERQLGRIDLNDIRKEIIAEGREKAREQFKQDYDKILEDYNENLNNIKKIYSNIAETLANNGTKGTTLTIG